MSLSLSSTRAKKLSQTYSWNWITSTLTRCPSRWLNSSMRLRAWDCKVFPDRFKKVCLPPLPDRAVCKDVHWCVPLQHSHKTIAPTCCWGSSWHSLQQGAWEAVSSLRSSIWAKVSEGTEAAGPTAAMSWDTSLWWQGRSEVHPGSQNQQCKVRIRRKQGQTQA